MWELIKENQRKSIILFAGLAMCLLVIGYSIGLAIFPPDGGNIGLLVALGIWIIMSLFSIFGGEAVILSSSRAQEVTHDMHPQLFNIAEEMKIAASFPVLPKLYIMHDPRPNAFATGFDIKNSSIVVTTGLMEKLNRDELQGVVAHEMSHIMNRDVQFMTLAGIMLGTITLISEVFLRGMFYSSMGSSRRYSSRRSSSGGGQAQIMMIIVAVCIAILAPLLAQIFYFAISRKREYLADASAVRLTRYPEGLASALEKISGGVLPWQKMESSNVNKITAPMYIVNPIKPETGVLSMKGLSSTHPPTAERVMILRGMMSGGGANYKDYQRAFSRITQGSGALIPSSGLSDKNSFSIREPSQDMSPVEGRLDARNIGDLVRAASGFAFLVCICGMKIKLPPNFKKSKMDCPRCKRNIEVPMAEMLAVGAVLDQTLQTDQVKSALGERTSQERLKYKRKGNGWESVSCSCGHMMQISPMFLGTRMNCPKCKSTLEIE